MGIDWDAAAEAERFGGLAISRNHKKNVNKWREARASELTDLVHRKAAKLSGKTLARLGMMLCDLIKMNCDWQRCATLEKREAALKIISRQEIKILNYLKKSRIRNKKSA